MTTQINRAYKGSDTNMLTASAIILENAEKYKAELTAKRSNWVDPFFPNMILRVDNAFLNILGVDSAKSQRDATALLNSIMAASVNDLSDFKVQIEQDFKASKPQLNEMLNNLGFTMHGNSLHQKNQSEVIELLFRFKTNMTPALQTTITAKGTSAELITAIIGYATQLSDSNISQEKLKSNRKILTNDNKIELNGIYNDVIAVGTIAARFFKDNKPVSEQFSYAKILRTLGGSHADNGNGAAESPQSVETGNVGVIEPQPI